MLLGDMQSKLKKLNSRLYIKTDERKEHAKGFHVSGIYLKASERVKLRFKNDKSAVHWKQGKYLEALERGELDRFICGVCLEHVPEYDVFCFVKNNILAPGWRKIVLKLVKYKICTLDQARNVFNRQSLGESDYDKMSFFKRLEWSRKLSEGTNA